MNSTDLFARVTQQIMEQIEAGAAEYHMPWHRWSQSNSQPSNAASGRPYRGINTLILWAAAESEGYHSGSWATYRQWSQLGGQVRRCERSTAIVFWRGLGSTGATELPENQKPSGVVSKVYCVFNADQVDGICRENGVRSTRTEDRSKGAEDFIAYTKARICHGGDMAYYSPVADRICIPYFGQFRDAESYYSVLAHECVHWSGAKHRLDRDLSGRFGSNSYAMEELIAELGAAFIAGRLGICVEPRPDHAAYMASWLRVLSNDNRAILTAAGKAQEAVDFLANFAPGASQTTVDLEVVDALGLEPRTR